MKNQYTLYLLFIGLDACKSGRVFTMLYNITLKMHDQCLAKQDLLLNFYYLIIFWSNDSFNYTCINQEQQQLNEAIFCIIYKLDHLKIL